MKRTLSLILIIALFAVPTFAHERQVINISGTPYLFVIGNLNEPVFTGDKTGIDLRIRTADPRNLTNSQSNRSKPVLGLESTLQAELLAENFRKEQTLEAAYGNPGAYETTYYPTAATHITYHVFGTINGTPVDFSFHCSSDGHHSNHEDMIAQELSVHVTRIYSAGAFTCPRAKEEALFPPLPASPPKHTWLLPASFALSALTLLLVLIRTRRKK